MLTLITPCCRQHLLSDVEKSIQFDKINKWIIVYDTTNTTYEKIYTQNEKVIETEATGGGGWGNAQKNKGLSLVEDGYVFFLDDDNIMHPNFWKMYESIDDKYFYTFNAMRSVKQNVIMYGNKVVPNFIDAAMYLVHKKHFRDIRLREEKFSADGWFIFDVYNENPGLHKYINDVCCHYNYLQYT
jgi:hypothetical protein